MTRCASRGCPPPRDRPAARALANLQNFHRNLPRNNAMALLGPLLADGIRAGELPPSAGPDVLTTMLIGSFHARYLIGSGQPAHWAQPTLHSVWPDHL